MQLHDVILAAAAFFSEIFGTISGFGSSTFFVPTAVLFESFNLVLALTAILHCFSNLSKISLFKDGGFPSLLWKLAIPSVIFTAIGAWLSKKIPAESLKIYLGLVLMFLPLLMIFWNAKKFHIPLKLGIFVSGLSGFATGLIGTGGAIRGLVLTAMEVEKNSFILISAGIDLGGDIVRAVIYLRNGYMDWNQWFYVPLLGTAALCGAKLGQLIVSRIRQDQFEKIVSFFVFVSGLMMVVS